MKPEQQVALASGSIQVTALGLGTGPIGGLYEEVSEEQAEGVVRSALALGLRLFDTAPFYGYGLAETRLGRVLRESPRQDFVLSTKVGRLLRPKQTNSVPSEDPGSSFRGTPPMEPVFDYSYDGVMRSLDESLTRLGLDRADIVYIHDPEAHYKEAMAGAYPALDRLRREKVVTAIGVGTNQAEVLLRFAREGDFDCFLLANRYTLLEQGAANELLPLCEEQGISVVAGGVFNSGILANPRAGEHYDYGPASPAVVERAQQLDALCREYDVPLKAAALQFPLGHPAVKTVLTGARSGAELAENARMFGHEIPPELWQAMKERGFLSPDARVPA